jgi:ubiquinone/menaquinone biosynthesis C-methylase UbiE
VHSYILDNASTAEYERLDLMSKILDPRTTASLVALGLREGWNCLELGGGNGSITEWLSDKVGVSGSVTSIDINPKLIKLVPAPNVIVRQEDVRVADLPVEAFDLVLCRALLHQIAEQAQAVLTKMAAAVRPGGWLFVFDMVRNRVVDAGFVDAKTLDSASAVLADPNSWTQCWMLTSAWLRKQ